MKKLRLWLLLLSASIVLTACGKTTLTSEKTIEKLYESESITMESYDSEKDTVKITNKDSINQIVKIISNAEEVKGFVNLEGNDKKINFYDKDDERIYSLNLWSTEGYIGFESKEFKITKEDISDFNNIMEEFQ